MTLLFQIMSGLFIFGIVIPLIIGIALIVAGIILLIMKKVKPLAIIMIVIGLLLAVIGVSVGASMSSSSLSSIRTVQDTEKNTKDDNKKEKIDIGKRDKKGTQYVYSNESVIKDVTIYKTVYDKDEVRIYISGEIDTRYLYCYDKEFEKIECDWDYSYKKGVLKIKGKKATNISGICVSGYSVMTELRYLDSDQYAILQSYFADDLGWELCGGDEELYYTEEEINKQKEAVIQKQKEQDEIWESLVGVWYCESNSALKLDFCVDENGNRKLVWTEDPDGDGTVEENWMSVDQLEESENFYDQTISLYITEGIGWGFRYEYTWTDDKTVLESMGNRYIRAE